MFFVEYGSGWEKTKGSKQIKYISAWGNEPHPVGHWKVNTEPFHYHHIPENPPEGKNCRHIHSLKDALEFVRSLATEGQSTNKGTILAFPNARTKNKRQAPSNFLDGACRLFLLFPRTH